MHATDANAAETVGQVFMLVLTLVMGLSHVLQPAIWTRFFTQLAEKGTTGVILHSFLSLFPGAAVLAIHRVWHGPAAVVTGWACVLVLKASSGFLVPQLALRSLRLSRHGDAGFRAAGVVMLAVAAAAALALLGW